MKKITLLIIIVFLSDTLYCQVSEYKKNSIYLEFYQPIQTPSLREFYNDEWMLIPSNKYLRHYFSNSVGLCYEKVLKNNIVIRPRFGMTFRNLKEENSTDKFFNSSEDVIYNEKYDYNQKHINLFLGLAKRLQIVNHFNLDLGLDISSVFYLNGNTEYYGGYTYYWTGTSEVKGADEYWWTNKVGKASCYGIGPYIKPEYYFSNNLSISVEIQMFFMYSVSKDESTTTSQHRTWWDPNANGGIPYLLEESSEGKTEYDFGQWSWSRLSPLIRIGYKF